MIHHRCPVGDLTVYSTNRDSPVTIWDIQKLSAGCGPTAGTVYLLRRRANLTARADSWQRGAARREEIHAVLSRLAVAARRHAPQDTRLTGNEDGWMVLNGGYLVDSGRSQEFAAAASRW